MAVLPTPGSPISTGLFLVRRLRHLDDAPDLLVAADDRVELARAGLLGQVAAVLLERLVGALGVRRGDALAAADVWSAPRIASRPAPWRSSSCLALAADLGDAEQQVLGRDVLVAEAPGLVLGPVDDPLRARVEAQRAALDPGAAREDGGQLAAERPRSTPSRRSVSAGIAVVGLDERGEHVLGVEDRAVEVLGEVLGGDDRLLGLLGEAVELHGSVLVAFRGKGCQQYC